MTGSAPERVEWAIRKRLQMARVGMWPFPHLVVDDLWPDELVHMVAAAWPADEAFSVNNNGRRANLELQPTKNADSGRYKRLTREQRAVWELVTREIHGSLVGPWLVEQFRDEVSARHEALRAHASALPFDVSDDWRVTPGRIQLRGPGYDLRPHADPAMYVVTALYYMGGAAEAQGTVLYRPERPLTIEEWAREGRTAYFHDAGVGCTEAVRVPFAPNRLLAFVNGPGSAHGIDKLRGGEGYRKVLQFQIAVDRQ
jgi:hypothetical protein